MPLIIYNETIEKEFKELLRNVKSKSYMAKHFGVTRPTIYSWMKKPGVRLEVKKYETIIRNFFES